jgi:hypothetical protein
MFPCLANSSMASLALVTVSVSESLLVISGRRMPTPLLVESCCEWLCACYWDRSPIPGFAHQYIGKVLTAFVGLPQGLRCWSSFGLYLSWSCRDYCLTSLIFQIYFELDKYNPVWTGPDQAHPVQDCQSGSRSSPTFLCDRTRLCPTPDLVHPDWWNH